MSSVAVWADTMLEAGDEWRKEIQQALAQLDAASIEVRKELAALPRKARE